MLNTDLERCRARHAALRGGAWRRLPHAVVLGLLLVSGSIVAAMPADVILVLDNSGSMRGNDPQFLLKPAVNGFISNLDSQTHVGMIIFDHKVRYGVPLGPLDPASREALGRSLEGIDYRGQFTDSPAAIERAIYELKANAREDASPIIVFMTDGIVDTGNATIDAEKAAWLRDELAADAADNGISIFGIAFTDEADFFLIQSLAKRTNGEYFRAPQPEQLADVFATIEQRIAAPPATAQAAATPMAAVEAVADKPPSAAAPATCLDTLSAEERLAMEETAPEVGITAEEMCREMEAAGAGSVIVHAPPDSTAVPAAVPEDDVAGVVLVLALGVLLLVVLGIVAIVVVRRRRDKGGADTAATLISAARDPEAYLEDIQGTTQEGRVRLGSQPLLIGRVAGADPEHVDYFVIDKGTVGRRHALIRYRDLAFWLSDQDSVNGTFLNGERISSERRLKHGDRIKFHKYEFQFSMPELEAADHTVFASSHDATIAANATQIGATVATAAAALGAAPRRADEEGDMFDITAEGPTEDRDLDEGRFVAAGEPARPGAAADEDMFDSEGVTEMPARPVEVPAYDGGMAGFSNQSSTGSGDAFDAAASVFFDDDLGPPAVDENQAVSFSRAADTGDDDEFATVLPDASASADSDVFSESETLLPDAPYADGDTAGAAVDISLDEFMESASFYSQMPDDDDRGTDATLMPEQVPNEVTMTLEYGDMFESTGLRSAAGANADDGDSEGDDDGSESPTRFRD